MIAIYEQFQAFQGEGVHSGKRAFFVRTYGCPVECSFCDSAGTWHKSYRPDNVQKYSEDELSTLINNQESEIVIVTGGEPSLYDWSKICYSTRKKMHIETCGGFDINGDFDWVTISPKDNKPPIARSLRIANELKLICTHADSIEKWQDVINQVGDIPIYLHPEWGKRSDPEILNLITNHIKYGDPRFRAGYQLHKLYACDSLDKNSKPLVPLGGIEENGY